MKKALLMAFELLMIPLAGEKPLTRRGNFLTKAVERLKLGERTLIDQLKQDFTKLNTWLQNWK